MGYEYLTSVHDQAQAAFVESILKAGAVRYNISTNVASRVIWGLSLNQIRFNVHPQDYEKALRVLDSVEDYTGNPKSRFTKKKASNRHGKRRHGNSKNEQREKGGADGDYGYIYAILLVMVVAFLLGLLLIR